MPDLYVRQYNVFGFMERYGIEYGYRLVARDLPHGDRLDAHF